MYHFELTEIPNDLYSVLTVVVHDNDIILTHANLPVARLSRHNLPELNQLNPQHETAKDVLEQFETEAQWVIKINDQV